MQERTSHLLFTVFRIAMSLFSLLHYQSHAKAVELILRKPDILR